MKKAFKVLMPAAVAMAVALMVPYIGSNKSCFYREPLLLFGSILGCGESKQPPASTSGIESDGRAPSSGSGKSRGTGKVEHRVTFMEFGSVDCIPCRMMQPVMREIERDYSGQVTVVFHDVWTDAGRPQAKKYGIRAIPTQVFLDRDGKEYFRHIGFFPREELVKVLKMKGVN